MRRLFCWMSFVALFGLAIAAASSALAQSSLRLTSYEDTMPVSQPQQARPVQPFMPVQPITPPASQAVQPRRMPDYHARQSRLSTVATPQATAVTSPAARPLPSNVRNVIGFFGSQQAADTLQQMPQRPELPRQQRSAIPPRQQQMLRTQNKPFAAASNGPTVSPYLNLYREEDFDSAPNYYAFVRPQMEQLEANERQQSELLRLNRQVQRMSYGTSAAGTTPAATPSTGHRVRFGDTAQFYGGYAR